MTRGTRRSVGFTSATALFYVAATLVAAAAFWPIYQHPHFLLMVAGALVVGCAIAIGGARFGWPAPVMLAATLIAYLALGVPLAVPNAALNGVVPTVEGVLELVSGPALGWRQLVTIAIPVGTYQSLLVPAFSLILVSTVIGLSIALRFDRGELACLAPSTVLLAGLAFGPREAPFALALTVGFLAVVLGWLSWRRWYRRREAIVALAAASGTPLPERSGALRVGASAVTLLVLASGLGVAVAAAAPVEQDRTVLRDVVAQPFDPQGMASPLSGLRRYHQADRSEAPMLRITGLPDGERIRLATLDTYDGVVYSVGTAATASESGSFTRLPTSVDREDAPGDRVTVEIEVLGYEGAWVPLVGMLEEIRFAGTDQAALRDSFFFNDTGLTGIALEGLDEGDRLHVNAVIPPRVELDQVSSLTPGTASVPDIERYPESLAVALDEWVRGAETPGGRLAAMLEHLRSAGYVSHGVDPEAPVSRSGHTVDRIDELIEQPLMIGDDEQYAVAAALMARVIGFPSRVVFGFAPQPTDAGPAIVTGSDIAAWIEVHTVQHGWIALDPVPDPRPIPDEQPETPATVARPQSPVPPPAVEPDATRDQAPLEATQDEDDEEDPLMALLLAVLRVVAMLAIVLLILSSPLLAILIAKMRRRHLRQRAPTASQRIIGGWREFEDAALDHGHRLPTAATRSEIAHAVGGVRPLLLAAVADRAEFSPESIDDADEARRVWIAVRDMEAAMNAGRSRWQRFGAMISLRSLAGYSVKDLLTRERRTP